MILKLGMKHPEIMLTLHKGHLSKTKYQVSNIRTIGHLVVINDKRNVNMLMQHASLSMMLKGGMKLLIYQMC